MTTKVDKIIEKIEETKLDDGFEIGGGEAEAETQAEKPAKPKPTPRTSWKPANLMKIPEKFKNPNYAYYCANWKWPGRILKLQNEGWEVDTEIMPKMKKAGMIPDLPATLQDGVPKDNTLRFRELVVLRMPKEMAEERKRYYRGLNPLKQKLEEEDRDLDEKLGGRGYGKINVKRGG